MKNRRIVKNAVAMVVALSMALAVTPVAKLDAAKKKPTLSRKSLTMMAGDTATLKVKPNKNKISAVTWKSTNEAVATVSKKGKVKAQSEGKATIKATFKVKGAKKKTTLKCKVKVEIAPMVGAWERAEDPTIPEIAKAKIKEFNDTIDGVSYEPVAILATQLVAGMNYRVLCKKTVITPEAKTNYAIIEIGFDLNGQVMAFDGNVASSEHILAALPDEQATESPAIPADAKEIITADITGLNSNLAPVAVIGKKTLGTDTEYLVLCDVYADGTNVSFANYVFVTLKIDAERKTTYRSVYPIARSIDDDYYKVCTDLPATKVESFARYVRNAIVKSEWTKVSEVIRYPIEINKEKIADAKAFLAFVEKNPPSASFIKALTEEVCTKVFARDQGVMLGADGQIWFNENATKDGFEITTIQLWADK